MKFINHFNRYGFFFHFGIHEIYLYISDNKEEDL